MNLYLYCLNQPTEVHVYLLKFLMICGYCYMSEVHKQVSLWHFTSEIFKNYSLLKKKKNVWLIPPTLS